MDSLIKFVLFYRMTAILKSNKCGQSTFEQNGWLLQSLCFLFDTVIVFCVGIQMLFLCVVHHCWSHCHFCLAFSPPPSPDWSITDWSCHSFLIRMSFSHSVGGCIIIHVISIVLCFVFLNLFLGFCCHVCCLCSSFPFMIYVQCVFLTQKSIYTTVWGQ